MDQQLQMEVGSSPLTLLHPDITSDILERVAAFDDLSLHGAMCAS